MTGTILSQYRIEAELGRGGMGIVYRAHDTRLDRTVALKVLPPHALASEDDRARFQREARAAAKLNHPHIAAIYEIGEAAPRAASEIPAREIGEAAVVPAGDESAAASRASSADLRPFIAMEYVDGESLAARIGRAPLKLDEAVRIATQIADALGAAHEAGVVHRDVKSGNVMLTAKGDVKVLDFGLAKTAASTQLTRLGATVGTIAYMSPEQARGEEVDGRTDLWALGVILYEMIAGRLPFAADYEQAVLYAILNEDPAPLTALRTGVPMSLEWIVDKCLAKDRALRYGSAGEIVVDLRRVDILPVTRTGGVSQRSPGTVPAAAESHGRGRARWLWPVGLVIAVVLAGLVGSSVGRRSEEPRLEKLVLQMDGVRYLSGPRLSPNGRHIAFGGEDTLGWRGLFLYDLRQGSLARIERTEGGSFPWFSPSGNRLAYLAPEAGSVAVYVVDVAGVPSRVCACGAAYWDDEDHLIVMDPWTRNAFEYEPLEPGQEIDADEIPQHPGIFRLEISTGRARQLAHADSTMGRNVLYPGPPLPGTRTLLANTQNSGNLDIEPQFFSLSLDTGEMTLGDKGIVNPQGFANGIVIHQVGDDVGPLVARRFDAKTGRLAPETIEIVDRTVGNLYQAGPDGSLLLVPRSRTREPRLVLARLSDRHVVATMDIPESREREIMSVTATRDGRTALLGLFSTRLGAGQSRRFDLASGRSSLEDDEPNIRYPAIAGTIPNLYAALRADDSTSYLARRPIDRVGRFDTVSVAVRGLRPVGESTSGFVVEYRDEVGAWRLGVVDAESRSVEPLGDDATLSRGASVSPDGRFVAFRSVRGSAGRLAVLDLSNGRVQDLLIDGFVPTWSPLGGYVYYMQSGDLHRLPVSTNGGFRQLAEPEFVLRFGTANYTVVNDDMLLVAAPEVSFDRSEDRSGTIYWWRGYSAELDRLLPR